MTREIKFRAWDKNDKQMLFMGGIFNRHPFTEMSTFPQYESVKKYHEVEMMQFTGLRDKDGKEIYEGDILKHPLYPECEPWVVKWSQTEYNAWFDFGYLPQLSQCEVIGNIYENPELLEATT